jgi:hypothetical protein
VHRRLAKGAIAMKSVILPSALLTLVFSLPLPATAQTLTRTFVSSTGVDSNPCTIAQPCATFARAYGETVPGGIVAALDPGKYGPLTIDGSITINGNGWAAITGPASGTAITIYSGSVTLIGLEIDGANASYNGIDYVQGESLTITNCLVQGFAKDSNGDPTTGNGILIEPTAYKNIFVITNTIVSQNANVGLYYRPPSGGTDDYISIDHVTATANGFGIGIDSSLIGSGITYVAISNSNVSNNSSTGISIVSGNSFSIDNTTISGNTPGMTITGASGLPNVSINNATVSSNADSGIVASGDPNVVLGRSTITANGAYGVNNQTTHNPTQFYTYGDNRINLNYIGNVNGTALKPLAVQ